MAYATVYQVLARNSARGTYNAQTLPSDTQVVQYLEEAAGQIDAWLYDGGYDAPFDSYIASGLVPTSAVFLLQRWNSIGAALAVEEGAQTTDPRRLEAFQKMWNEVHAACEGEDLPLPALAGKAFPRGFGEGKGVVQPQEFKFDHTTPQRYGRGAWDL